MYNSKDWSRFPTHIRPSLSQIRRMRAADLLVAGGSNMLNSHMERNRQWLVTPDLAVAMAGKVVLCGVGWWQYQSAPCAYSRMLLKRLLSREAVHSVRDSYTQRMIESLGFRAVNTGCPTMWSLATVEGPFSRHSTVITTITDYNRDPERDRRMLQLLRGAYSKVLLVGMAREDLEYFDQDLRVSGVDVAGWGVDTLNRALDSEVDYFGTRLHAGVRAMQKSRTAGVLAIDNRATEIASDTGLCVLTKSELANDDCIDKLMDRAALMRLRIDTDSIAAWKTSFGGLAKAAGI